MLEISIEELFGFYLDTIGAGSSEVLSLDDEGLAHSLFEEFDVGATSFLHETSLERLVSARRIDEQAAAESRSIRQKWALLQERTWRVSGIRKTEEWRELFAACDKLLSRVQ